MSTTLLELAEDSALHMPLRPGFVEPTISDRYGFFPGPMSAMIQRIRIADGDVEEVVDELRALAQSHGLQRLMWWVGDAATPTDLGEQLEQLGFAPMVTLTTMALTDSPIGASTAHVREVATLDEWLLANEIDQIVEDVPEGDRPQMQDFNRRSWPEVQARRVPRMYLAYIDDEPVGYARAILTTAGGVLLGGGTLPEARHRGVYTSLVHARWQDVVDESSPALVVQAGASSEPILRHLGFTELGKLRLYGGT